MAFARGEEMRESMCDREKMRERRCERGDIKNTT